MKRDDPANASATPKSSRYRRWEAAFPESPIRPVAEPSAWIDYAWQARGSGWARTVTDEGWQRFAERLATSVDRRTAGAARAGAPSLAVDPD